MWLFLVQFLLFKFKSILEDEEDYEVEKLVRIEALIANISEEISKVQGKVVVTNIYNNQSKKPLDDDDKRGVQELIPSWTLNKMKHLWAIMDYKKHCLTLEIIYKDGKRTKKTYYSIQGKVRQMTAKLSKALNAPINKIKQLANGRA